MNDYWTTAVSRYEHDERIRRARWDAWASEIIRERRAQRRALKADRKAARSKAAAPATPVRSSHTHPSRA